VIGSEKQLSNSVCSKFEVRIKISDNYWDYYQSPKSRKGTIKSTII